MKDFRRRSKKLHRYITRKTGKPNSSTSNTVSKNASTADREPAESFPDAPAIVEVPTIWNLPPFPRPKTTFTTSSHSSGTIMVGRALASLVPPPITSRRRYDPLPEPRARIPGWTDGSLEWRDVLYNIRSPKSSEKSVFWNGGAISQGAETGQTPVAEDYFSLDKPDDVLIREHLALFTRREERRISAYLPRDVGPQATTRLWKGTGSYPAVTQHNYADEGHKPRGYVHSKLSATSFPDATEPIKNPLRSASSIYSAIDSY